MRIAQSALPLCNTQRPDSADPKACYLVYYRFATRLTERMPRKLELLPDQATELSLMPPNYHDPALRHELFLDGGPLSRDN
jgi:hypothetical protein